MAHSNAGIFFVSLVAMIMLTPYFLLKCKAAEEPHDNGGAIRQSDFRSQLTRLTQEYPDVEDIGNDKLYSLGRAYIRGELDKQLAEIEQCQLDTPSEVIILKSMYELFNYANPAGLDVSSVPSGVSAVSANGVLAARFKVLYEHALDDAVEVYDYGDQVYSVQLYEMGRCLLFSRFHDDSSPLSHVSDAEREVLKRALYVLCYLNVPGGFNTDYAPSLPVKTHNIKKKDTKWERVEKYLTQNGGVLGIGPGLIGFLVGTPTCWKALSVKLSETDDWQSLTLTVATTANRVLTEAAGHYTDLANEADEYDHERIYANHISGDDYGVFMPIAVRIHVIENVESNPNSTTIAENMLAFAKYGSVYGMKGWQGIARIYSSKVVSEIERVRLNDFKEYLVAEGLLMDDVDLGSNKDAPLKTFLNDFAGESKLGEFFTDSSVYSVF